MNVGLFKNGTIRNTSWHKPPCKQADDAGSVVVEHLAQVPGQEEVGEGREDSWATSPCGRIRNRDGHS